MTKFLEQASKAYYEGTPIISDEEFDYLAELHGFNKVGYDAEGTFPHFNRMYSLQKAYVGDGKFPLDWYTNYIVKTPKLDGAAISLLYVKDSKTRTSVLKGALSRGDGKRGKNIYDNIKHKVPNTINLAQTVQITCEVVAPKRVSDNPRNYAAGALNLKDEKEFLSRDLTVVALDIHNTEILSYENKLIELEHLGFITPTSPSFNVGDYPTDGVVYRINDEVEFNKAGYTSKHPRGAFALKTQAEGVWSTLERVEWNVGRSGVVTPVAHISPISIDGATVSRATLHNMAHINSLGLRIGDKVELIRSGEIIPKIIGRKSADE